jgi:hypothetical protein
MPTTLVDSNGVTWQVTEAYLVPTSGPSQKLERVASHMSFWFGWFQFHPDTEVYTPDAQD